MAALLVLGVGASYLGHLRQERGLVVAAIRAIIQLTAVSFIIVAALTHLVWACAFAALMFGVAVWTTSKRTGLGRAWPWAALAMASGALPVLTIVFASGTAPLNGASVVPLAGIVIGNMMTVHTLLGRRTFAALRDNIPTYEAALSIGLVRPEAIREVTQPTIAEALLPTMDQTRTVGLVTLPGAFVGVLLGGGSPVQAGAAQVLVLVGIMAGQAVTTTVAHRLIREARLLPPDLRARLRP
ncbi:MAG TPA: ABC transporter permease [Propionibacteriaceae bacterium]|nr:ABC transporter permease [Propionibacteriaceae bacterium]